jgi:hypothetical protein
MYTVQKIETPDRGTMFAVGEGESIVNRWLNEDDAKENCTALNGGEAAEKKLAAAEKAATEAAEKAAADHEAARTAKPKAAKSQAQPAKAKQHVKRMTPKRTARARRK